MTEWPEPGQRLQTTINGPVGLLDALVETPDSATDTVAVVCHPHPQQGGAKTNKVTYTLARAATQSGCASVRFDFRGVGESEGAFDNGVGEVEDALAVAEWAQATSGCKHLVLAGFSFGSAVALRAAMQRQPIGLITVALPTRYFDNGLPQPACPWYAVHGDADEVADPDVARSALQALSSPPETEWLGEAGHFFHGRLSELRSKVATHLSSWL